MKTWKVEAAIIAVGMVLLGVIIKWGINAVSYTHLTLPTN